MESMAFTGLREALRGRFNVERVIGRGGTASVYCGRDLKHDRWVALKVLHPDVAARIGADRFLQEIEITARLQHPHILPLLDSGEAGGFLYLVTPFVQGNTVRDLLKKERRLPVSTAVTLALEVADALAYAHAQQVAHLDIKPGNILLSNGHAMVADFGIARAISDYSIHVASGGLPVGTPAYMSPEQVAGSLELDGASDQYSLACLVFEMITGNPPFQGSSAAVVMSQHLNAEAPSLRRATWGIPPELDRTLIRALAKTPEGRYESLDAFSSAVAAVIRPKSGIGMKGLATTSVLTALILGAWAARGSGGEPVGTPPAIAPDAGLKAGPELEPTSPVIINRNC